MIVLFTLVTLTVVYGYVGWRLITPSGLPLRTRGILWKITGIFMLMPIISFTFMDSRYSSLSWLSFLVFGVFNILLFFVVLRDLILVGVSVAGVVCRWTGFRSFKLMRHSFVRITNLLIISITALLTVYGVVTSFLSPVVRKVEISVGNTHAGINGLRIVHLSDLHIGRTLKTGFVEKIVGEVNRLKPDIVVITGDIADGPADQVGKYLDPISKIEASMGKYYVTGNHEYYFGAEAWIREMERLGFVPLVNTHITVEYNDVEIAVAGVPDYNSGHLHYAHLSNPFKAIKAAPELSYKILLTHTPQLFDRAVKAGYDLVLAGHTHGGQYFPGNILVRLFHPRHAGLHNKGNTFMYVSRGTGYWGPPLRIFSPSELTLLILTNK